jgi:D-alanyl-lipoteichoic acid acyltransferase DltB (MBOAT superfamily)
LLFVPITIGTFLLLCRRCPPLAVAALLIAAALYCWITDLRTLVWLSISLIANYMLMTLIRTRPGERERRWLTALGIVTNLAPLVAYKWLAAHPDQIGAAAAVGPDRLLVIQSAVVPLGMAFFTLQQITFLIDAGNPARQPLGFARYAAWGSLFAQLPAGPIAPYRTMAEQYAKLGRSVPSREMVFRGATLFLAGLFKKAWIADPLGNAVETASNAVQSGHFHATDAWTLSWGFLVQLYFDFSAYSDIAIGLALCVGIKLPINFNSPLKASSPGQYVMRWHISLMMFVRFYVFEPVFQLARRLPVRPTARRYAVAWSLAMVTAFVAVGLWHTLALTKVIEAVALGLLLVVIQTLRLRWRTRPRTLRRAGKIAVHVITRVGILFAAAILALLLRTNGGATSMRVIGSMLDFGSLLRQAAEIGLDPGALRHATAGNRALLVATLVALLSPNTMQIFGIGDVPGCPHWIRWRPSLRWGFASGMLLVAALAGIAAPVVPRTFIYADI